MQLEQKSQILNAKKNKLIKEINETNKTIKSNIQNLLSLEKEIKKYDLDLIKGGYEFFRKLEYNEKQILDIFSKELKNIPSLYCPSCGKERKVTEMLELKEETICIHCVNQRIKKAEMDYEEEYVDLDRRGQMLSGPQWGAGMLNNKYTLQHIPIQTAHIHNENHTHNHNNAVQYCYPDETIKTPKKDMFNEKFGKKKQEEK